MEEPHSPNREKDKMIGVPGNGEYPYIWLNGETQNIFCSYEFDEKIVTDEMLQEKENLSKIKDRYLNGVGRYIKHFSRITRTSNGSNI